MELIFPFNGVNKGSMKSAQPKGTAYQARNVVPIDSLDGRIRGGQRPGLKDLTTKGAVIDTLQTTNISPLTAVWTNNGRRFNVTNGNNISVNEYVKITARSQYEFDLKGTEVLHIKVITDGYNVDPNGGTATTGNVDSTVGLQAAITDGFGTAISSSNTIRGLAICNTIIDLEGGNYLISDELVIPTGASVKFINGAIVASATFTSGEYLIRNTGTISGTTTKTCVLKNAFITFENILLLGSGIANGVKMIGCDNFVFQNCHCQNYKDYGVYVWGGGNIHGFRAIDSVVNQYDWEDVWTGTTAAPTRVTGVLPAGVGIYCAVYDSSISGCDVYLTGTGIVVARSSMIIENCHPWGCTNLIVAEPYGYDDETMSNLMINGVYFDCGGNPDYGVSAVSINGICQDCSITNSTFTRPNNAPSTVSPSTIAFSTGFSFILLGDEATSKAMRLSVEGNTFYSDNPLSDSGLITSTLYDKAASTGCIFENNRFNEHVYEFSTSVEYDYPVFENGSKIITLELDTVQANTGLRPFGSIQSVGVEYRTYPDGCGGKVNHTTTGDYIQLHEVILGKYIIELSGGITNAAVAWTAGTYTVGKIVKNGSPTSVVYRVKAAVSTTKEPGVTSGWADDWEIVSLLLSPVDLVVSDVGTHYIPIKNTTAGALNVCIATDSGLTIASGTTLEIPANYSTVLKVVVAETTFVPTVTLVDTTMTPTYMHIGGRRYDAGATTIKYRIDIDTYDATNSKFVDGYFRTKVVYG